MICQVFFEFRFFKKTKLKNTPLILNTPQYYHNRNVHQFQINILTINIGLKAWLDGSKVTFENLNFTLTKIITISHLTNYVTQCALPYAYG